MSELANPSPKSDISIEASAIETSAAEVSAIDINGEEQAFGRTLPPIKTEIDSRSPSSISGSPLSSAIVWVGREERSLSIWLQWLFVIAVTAVLSASVGAAIALFDPLKPEKWLGISAPVDITNPSIKRSWDQGWQYRLTRPMNIAIIGVDHSEPGAPPHQQSLDGRSDTLLVARLNPREKLTTVLSVPRDTLVTIPGHGRQRINQANALGGPALVSKTLQENLGDLPIDRYVRINTLAFRELIDLLGGVEIFVPRPMEYTDRTQGLEIQLTAGWQTITGDQAEQFVRYRGDGLGDIGRVQRQ
ncbi:MAG: LCP family protein, partial [Cyanobacteria bacterium P01_F01_bin.153]